MHFVDVMTASWYVNMAFDHERTRWDQFFEAYGEPDSEFCGHADRDGEGNCRWCGQIVGVA